MAAALACIAPSASVKWNQRIPDRRTGHPRQIDVWIETTVCSHPLKIVGSCKHLSTRVDASDIDHLNGEVRAVGAHSGIIFSKVGFAETAIVAAEADGISCCLLVDGQLPDIRSPLQFRSFVVKVDVGLAILGKSAKHQTGTWMSFLSEQVAGDPPIRIADYLCNEAKLVVEETLKERGDFSGKSLSTGFRVQYLKINSATPERELLVELSVQLRLFECRHEAIIANGVANITHNTFEGAWTFPAIDTEGDHPGPGWRLLPCDLAHPQPAAFLLIIRPDLEPDALMRTLGSKPLVDKSILEAAEYRLRLALEPPVPGEGPP